MAVELEQFVERLVNDDNGLSDKQVQALIIFVESTYGHRAALDVRSRVCDTD